MIRSSWRQMPRGMSGSTLRSSPVGGDWMAVPRERYPALASCRTRAASDGPPRREATANGGGSLVTNFSVGRGWRIECSFGPRPTVLMHPDDYVDRAECGHGYTGCIDNFIYRLMGVDH